MIDKARRFKLDNFSVDAAKLLASRGDLKQYVEAIHSTVPPSNGESDPTGRSPHEAGAKLDAGKPLPALVLGGFASALEAVTAVGTYGAKKYSPNGWMEVPNGVERYTEAMLRHWLKEAKGELADPDTDLLHAAHLAWNALARLELMIRGQT
jgi:hypothetical protein